MQGSTHITCSPVAYRRGFIAVTPGVHEDCINVETWEVTSDAPSIVAGLDAFNDADIRANCELELTVAEANALITALQQAVDCVTA